jgi:hypothetical protein
MARQHTLTSFITELVERDANVRVTIQSEIGGGYIELDHDVDEDIEILLLTVSSRERQYSNPVTHECYVQGNVDFITGRRIVVTATKDEYGEWQTVTTGEDYLILGGARQWGVQAPRDHIRYDLCRLARGV